MARSFNIVVGLWLALLPACDTAGPYYADRDLFYSLFGYLDSRLDTNWVRVRMLQDSTLIDEGPLDAKMTMTNVSTGETVTWHDSLFSMVEGALAHNFWVTGPVFPLETYRLEVQRSDGAKSVTMVSLPDTFAMPIVTEVGDYGEIHEWVDLTVSFLVAADIYYYVPMASGGEFVYQVNYLSEACHPYRLDEGLYRIDFWVTGDLRRLEWNPNFLQRYPGQKKITIDDLHGIEIRVAQGGPNWPDFSLDMETQTLPGPNNFVVDGAGFVGGVVSRLITVRPRVVK